MVYIFASKLNNIVLTKDYETLIPQHYYKIFFLST